MEISQALNSAAKKDEIRALLGFLEKNIEDGNLLSSKKLQFIGLLKSLATTAEDAALFTKDDIRTLCYYALRQEGRSDKSETSIEVSHTALKCLANVLLLESKTRQYFVYRKENASSIAQLLNDSKEDELLCSRILFLLTYDTDFDFDELCEEYSLADNIHENIASHASQYAENNQENERPPRAVDTAALTESLKLLFNLNQFYPQHTLAFTKTIKPILEILNNIQSQSQPLQLPVTQLINALLSLDLSAVADSEENTPLFPKSNPNGNVNRLIKILDSAVRTLKEEELDGLVPLVTLMRRVYELAPAGIKGDVEAQLLPSNSERAQPLGKTDSLPSHLLRLSTNLTAPNLREGISSLLFELSNKDATTFVRNVGYGFAAGYLMTHSLPVPERTLNGEGEREDPGEKITKVDGQEVNPITGQRRDMEPAQTFPEMTDEEKEREAEKLFVLFERLKATGVMDVVNPVEQAATEGRLEELD